MTSIVKSDAALTAVINGLYAIEDVTMQTLLKKAESGAFPEAIADMVQLVATSDIVSQRVKDVLRPYITLLEQEAIDKAGKQLSQKMLQLALKMILAAFAIVNAGLAAGDLAAVAHDIVSSNQADPWTLALIKPTLILDPKTSNINAGDTVAYTVTPPVGSGGNIVYDWTQDSPFAIFSSSDNQVGKSIETSSTSVNLITTPSDQAPITVNVIAYKVGNGGGKLEIGRATAKVTINGAATGKDVHVLTGMHTYDYGNGNIYHSVFGWGFVVFDATQQGIYTVTASDGQGGRFPLVSVDWVTLQAPIKIVTADDLEHRTTQSYTTNPYYNFFNFGNGKVGMYYDHGYATDDPQHALDGAQLDALVNQILDASWNGSQFQVARG